MVKIVEDYKRIEIRESPRYRSSYLNSEIKKETGIMISLDQIRQLIDMYIDIKPDCFVDDIAFLQPGSINYDISFNVRKHSKDRESINDDGSYGEIVGSYGLDFNDVESILYSYFDLTQIDFVYAGANYLYVIGK